MKTKPARERIIERLNKEFAEIIGCIIPLDQPVVIQRRSQTDSEKLAWFFGSKYNEDDTADTALKNMDAKISLLGSYYTMTELLQSKRWQVARDYDDDRYAALGGLDIQPLENL